MVVTVFALSYLQEAFIVLLEDPLASSSFM